MATVDFTKKGTVYKGGPYLPGARSLIICHRIDTRPVAVGGIGPLAAATSDVVDLFTVPAGTPFRLKSQTVVLRTKSSTEATVKGNAAQTAFAVGPAQGAAVPLAVDGGVNSVTVTGNAETAAVAAGVLDQDGGSVQFSVATGTVTGAVLDIYTEIEVYAPLT